MSGGLLPRRRNANSQAHRKPGGRLTFPGHGMVAVPRPAGGLGADTRPFPGDTTPAGRWRSRAGLFRAPESASDHPPQPARSAGRPRAAAAPATQPGSEPQRPAGPGPCVRRRGCPRTQRPWRGPRGEHSASTASDPEPTFPRGSAGTCQRWAAASPPGTRAAPASGGRGLLCPEGLVSLASKISGHRVGFQKNTRVSET